MSDQSKGCRLGIFPFRSLNFDGERQCGMSALGWLSSPTLMGLWCRTMDCRHERHQPKPLHYSIYFASCATTSLLIRMRDIASSQIRRYASSARALPWRGTRERR